MPMTKVIDNIAIEICSKNLSNTKINCVEFLEGILKCLNLGLSERRLGSCLYEFIMTMKNEGIFDLILLLQNLFSYKGQVPMRISNYSFPNHSSLDTYL